MDENSYLKNIVYPGNIFSKKVNFKEKHRLGFPH